ncbi:MAG TPA: sensor histidine kinase, partial [Candidatus Saccharicenans sp.]|nr:sensor histidine kinase [Candidatus Saccharicenans sp.]
LTDPQARAAIRECQHRIKSMAMVHEKLYRAGDLARIDLAGYLSSLARSIFLEHQLNSDRIKLHLEIESVDLDLNVAVPLGLILNELITNAFVHAFPTGREGNIWVSFKKRPDDLVELRVKDDGVGFPPGLDFKKSESLGLVIINTLVEQIGGQLEMKPGEKREAGTGVSGTEFCLTFKG